MTRTRRAKVVAEENAVIAEKRTGSIAQRLRLLRLRLRNRERLERLLRNLLGLLLGARRQLDLCKGCGCVVADVARASLL